MKVNEAVQEATKQLAEVFPDSNGPELRLEGVQRTEDEKYWQIMFSYPEKEGRTEPFYRNYRTVKLRDADGAFMAAVNGLLSDAA